MPFARQTLIAQPIGDACQSKNLQPQNLKPRKLSLRDLSLVIMTAKIIIIYEITIVSKYFFCISCVKKKKEYPKPIL